MHEAPAKALAIEIKDEARRVGFSLVGITSPDPPAHLEVYRAWLSEGHHAGMAYMNREDARQHRADPRSILPECRAIIVLAANYLPGNTARDRMASHLQIASYALGDDYHIVLPERMRRLVEFVQERLGRDVRHKIYTDTGPLLERELAQRAGLGWIGKNSCLIHPRLGSYFVLGEILLDVPLPIDAPYAYDRCGTCSRCIDACPTQCILPDRTLDSRKCIAYWTIEARDAIALDVRSQIGDWLFGCDVCQQVCPFNITFARPSEDPAFQIRESLAGATLEQFLQLLPHGWRRRFKESPLLRARRRGLVRNAAVVAGNAEAPAFVPQLTVLLQQDPEPLVRSHAAWALGRIRSPQALSVLRAAHSGEKSPEVIEAIEAALRDSWPFTLDSRK
ncbi:MAG: tRNA epoxyqueuosine(34) reductase QueG [Anaerolineales bacterium]|jgi:epoxyqueuosine reductase